MNDKEISLGLSYDDYIETFNNLMQVGRILYPNGVSLKGFNNSYVFKKGGNLNKMSFLKGCNKVINNCILGYQS